MNELVPFDQLKEMALVMGKTGMFGKSPDQLMSLMLIAQAEGLHPAIAAQEYDIIQGRPAINSRAGLSLVQLAGLTGLAVSNISAIENGRRPVGLTVAKKLAEALGRPVAEFVEPTS
jgi:DNA-binding XRE family transcriptional regulator